MFIQTNFFKHVYMFYELSDSCKLQPRFEPDPASKEVDSKQQYFKCTIVFLLAYLAIWQFVLANIM